MVGGVLSCDDPSIAEITAIWLCRSTTTAEVGTPDDAGVPDDTDLSMISLTPLSRARRELVEDLVPRQALIELTNRLVVRGAALAARAAFACAHAESSRGTREAELVLHCPEPRHAGVAIAIPNTQPDTKLPASQHELPPSSGHDEVRFGSQLNLYLRSGRGVNEFRRMPMPRQLAPLYPRISYY